MDPGFDNECVILSAPDRAGLLDRLARMEALAADPPADARLAHLAADAAAEYRPAGATLALTASSFDELRTKLARARERLSKPETQRIHEKSGVYFAERKFALGARTAFVFPGEGAQYPNMLKGLCMRYPDARAPFDEFDEACADSADGYRPSDVIFPPPGASAPSGADALYEMRGAVHAVACANAALLRLFAKIGLRPDAAVGHSSGEFIALQAAGALGADDRASRVRFIREGYHLMERLAARGDIREGVLLTVGGIDRGEAEALIGKSDGALMLAMDNCPHQVVLCGAPSAIDAAAEELGARGAICARLPFNRPYHTPWFAPAVEEIDRLYAAHGLRAPSIEAWSCMTAAPFPADPAEIRRIAAQQWAAPVRFRETIAAMYASGVRVFVDAGPRGNMAAFIDDILREEPHLTIVANREHRSDIEQFHMAVAQLAAHGAALTPAALFARRAATRPPARPARAIALVSDPPRLRAPAIAPVPPSSPASIPAPTPAAAPVAGEREAVMHAYLDTMEAFLDSQRALLDRLFSAPPAASNRPLLGTIIERDADRRLAARRALDLREDLFLLDHTLGVEVSREDPALPALSIMPLTMSLALAAEAAQALMPELRVIGMADIQANRWISLEDGRLSLLTVAQRAGEGGAIRVEIREDAADDPRAAHRPPFVQATVLMGDAYPAAPAMPSIPLERERPSGWTGREIYGDRLFHLDRLQGLQSIDRWAETGMTGTVRVLPRDRLFARNPAPQFAVDGVLLDALGSALGLWGNYEKFDGTVFLPFRVRRIDFFEPPPPPGALLRFALALKERGPGAARCDIFAAHPDGRLHVRILDWEDRIWDISAGLHRLMLRAFDKRFSEPLALPRSIAERIGRPLALRIVRGIPFELLEGSHRVWQKVLAYLALDADGRAEFKALRGTERRRSEWLAARTTAKEAVRALLELRIGESPPPADIPIRADEFGRPRADGAWRARHPELTVHVSMAHRDGTAVAAACEGADVAGIGVDIEPLRAPTENLAEGAFAPEDRPADIESFWRRWCAKEAVGKALGVGLIHDARDLRICGEDASTGRVDIRFTGAWVRAFPALGATTVSAYTFADGNERIAICVKEVDRTS